MLLICLSFLWNIKGHSKKVNTSNGKKKNKISNLSKETPLSTLDNVCKSIPLIDHYAYEDKLNFI